MIDAAEPFARPVRRGWIPPEMLHAPHLDPDRRAPGRSSRATPF